MTKDPPVPSKLSTFCSHLKKNLLQVFQLRVYLFLVVSFKISNSLNDIMRQLKLFSEINFATNTADD